jgi:glycosyltransferase involved in cell wall biosynthesis
MSNAKKKPICYFYQRSFSNYNLELFKKVQDYPNINIKYFFDKDPSSLSDELDCEVTKSLILFASKNLSQIRYEVYLSYKFIFRVIKHKPDIIVSEDGGNIINNLVLIFLRKFINFKLIFWGLGSIRNRRQSWIRRLAQYLIELTWKQSDHIFAYSNFGVNVYQSSGIEITKITNITNALPGSYSEWENFIESREKNLPKEPINLVFVGRLIKTKKVDLLLEALAFLDGSAKRAKSKFQLLIVGDGPASKELKRMSKKIKNINIKFFGSLYGAELDKVLSKCHIGLMPGEGGLAINTFLTRGLPVVLGKNAGDGTELDLIQDQINGLFFEDDNYISLANSILDSLNCFEDFSKNIKTNLYKLPTTSQQSKNMLKVMNRMELSN